MIMGELSILGGSGPTIEELEEITMVELSLEEAVRALFEEKVLLLATYDNHRDKDILIRLEDTSNGRVTRVAKPETSMGGFVGTKRYWSLYDITINMLSMYPVYIYDPVIYNSGVKYEPNIAVEYTSSKGDTDIAIIRRAFRDEDCNVFYTLSGEGDKLFTELELKEMR